MFSSQSCVVSFKIQTLPAANSLTTCFSVIWNRLQGTCCTCTLNKCKGCKWQMFWAVRYCLNATVDFGLCAVLLTTFYHLLLAVWSHMNTVLCQPQSLASPLLFFFAEVWYYAVYLLCAWYYSIPHPFTHYILSLSPHPSLDLSPPLPPSLSFSLSPPLPPAQDAVFLLNKLFSLTTHSSHNCSSELFRALEACTQHTYRWDETNHKNYF